MAGAGAMASAWAAFRELSPGRHLAGILLAALLIGLRFGGPLLAAEPVEDEQVYAAAFLRAAHGESPYEGLQFYYLPPFAAAGAFLVEHAGLKTALHLLRFLNLLATAAILWLATGCWRLSFPARVAASALYGALAPPVFLALAWGNLSPLAIALWLATFLLWRRHPIAAGAAFAAALLVKPVAAIGIVLLALQEPGDRNWRKQMATAAVAAGMLLAVVLTSPHLGGFLALSGGIPGAARSASLHRLLHCFGLDLPVVWLLPAVALPAILLLRRRPRSPAELYLFAAVAGLLATPLVWSHTLLLALPLQSAALALAAERYALRRRAIEPLLAGAAVLSIQLSNGLGGIETWPLPLQGLFVALPCFAPLALAAYLQRAGRHGEEDPAASGPL